MIKQIQVPKTQAKFELSNKELKESLEIRISHVQEEVQDEVKQEVHKQL